MPTGYTAKIHDGGSRTFPEFALECARAFGALIQALRARVAELENVNAALLSQARAHAMEARTQRSTVNECLQAASGATGEKADWNGAQPVREALAERDRRVAELEAALEYVNHYLVNVIAERDEWERKSGMMARLALDEEAAKDEALAKGDKRIAELEAALGRLRDEMMREPDGGKCDRV